MLSIDIFKTLNEAASAMTDRSRYLAGGTLVMRDVTYGDQSFDNIIRVRDADVTIRSEAGGIRIGAGATMSDLLASTDVSFLHPVARSIGGPAIRNMATVGGNLFAQNPYGDLTTALLAMDAQIEMSSGQNQPIETFLSNRTTTRGLVAAVIVPRLSTSEFRFAKVSRVKPKGVSLIALAAWLRHGNVRIAFGNMGPTPLRAKSAERALNTSIDDTSIAQACAQCTEGLAPEDDALGSAWYRSEVAPIHLKRLLIGGNR
ncbi:MAG: FAD binding domain-containing protein [Paracoccaceae bacterium]